jgi:signal transduction histidine kinase/CheY-like chemotaxis protein
MAEKTMMYTTDEYKQIINMQARLIQREAELERQRYVMQKHESLIHALCKDYINVYHVDLDNDTFEPLRIDRNISKNLLALINEDNVFSHLKARYIEKRVHPDDRTALLERLDFENLKEELSAPCPVIHNFRVKKEDGDVYFQIKCARISGDKSAHEFILGIRNIDKRIRTDLEKNQLLCNALKEAEAANLAKTTFLNNMSHDIRTPMNAIIGFSDIAKRHMDDPERVADCLEKISQSSSHLLSLINDVLDMSRIESGKVQIDEQPENLVDIMGSLCSIIQSDLQVHSHRFSLDMAGVENEDIYCDKLRLNQVLLNLLSNAIKYTKSDGMISVVINQLPSDKDGYATYKFRVRDNGIGMSPEFARTIFEPFTREKTSTVSGIQGTGLGMSITKTLVDMMGGNISLETEQDVGSEFTVTLDLRLWDKISTSCDKDKKGSEITSLDGLKILLTEDNELNTEIAVEILTEAGCIVDTAENGKLSAEKLKASAPGTYDLILMDIQMPVMDGYEATKLIRSFKEPELSNIPIIAMTANAFEEDRKKALEAGMNAHVAKPVDVQKLFSAIQTVLK